MCLHQALSRSGYADASFYEATPDGSSRSASALKVAIRVLQPAATVRTRVSCKPVKRGVRDNTCHPVGPSTGDEPKRTFDCSLPVELVLSSQG